MWKSTIGSLLLCLAANAAGPDQQETIRKTFSGVKELVVDNVFGSIEVGGYAGREIQLSVRKTLRADSAEQFAEAGREVQLEISEENGTLRLYVDGPFRDRDGSRR